MTNIVNATIGQVDPIGVAQTNPNLDAFFQQLLADWKAIEGHAVAWWKVWEKTVSNIASSKFMLAALDSLIVFVEQEIPGATGADKKATVLKYMGVLFDFVVAEALPLWAKPFTPLIKQYVVDVLASAAIDWVVGKYNNGAWATTPTASGTMTVQMFGGYITKQPMLPKTRGEGGTIDH